MKKDIEVSVIMADYNTKEQDLRDAIASILNQTYSNFEFIIIDDGSANDLEKIAQDFRDKRIKVIKNPGNKGFVYSLNNAIKHSIGKYIVRMDTDDRALPTRIEHLLKFIQQHSEYAVVGSRAVEFSDGESGKILGMPGEKTKKSIMRGDTLVHPSTMFRREAIVESGCYDNFHRAEDLGLWCKLLVKGYRLYVLDEVLLEYRVNPEDYRKRQLRNRRGELQVRLMYYPKMNASLLDYLFIGKGVIAGLLSPRFVRAYRNKFVLKDK